MAIYDVENVGYAQYTEFYKNKQNQELEFTILECVFAYVLKQFHLSNSSVFWQKDLHTFSQFAFLFQNSRYTSLKHCTLNL